MSAPILTLRDDFQDNSTSAAWDAIASGSATATETSGEARFTLPSSTGGTHTARYTSNSPYDLTGGSFFINIDTMVATGVAATAFFQLFLSALYTLQWIQVSGTLYARTIIAGASVDRYSAAWNASTYKYLRITETGGNILWQSSTNGTSWTTRATLAIPFAITDLYVDFGATCGNIASPGSFRLDDVNLILPALSTNWNATRALWPLTERNKTTTIAIDAAGTVQGYLVTADGADVNDDPSGNIRYWSGPADGGRVLTEQASQADAEAMAVNFPLDGRFDLPEIIEARYFRLYHRSIDGGNYAIREFYPRRLVQADDIEAEFIRGLTISGHQFIADMLSAFTSNIGQLTITNPAGDAWIYQGTGTGDSPTTGLKIYNVGGIGKLSTYNATVEQVTLDTDGKLKAGGGKVVLDATGINIEVGAASVSQSEISWFHPSSAAFGVTMGATHDTGTGGAYAYVTAQTQSGNDASIVMTAQTNAGTPRATLILDGVTQLVRVAVGDLEVSGGDASISDGLNLGTSTGATAGAIKASGSAGFGDVLSANVRVIVKGETTDSSKYGFFAQDSSGATTFFARNDGRVSATAAYLIGGTQVVNARKTGWGTPTGTLYRTALTNASTQAQFNQAIMAAITDLISHGLLGA